MTSAGIHDTVPASCWEDAFPLGNGRHGALVHGGVREESVIVTHHHLVWPDAPEPPGPPDLSDRLETVRDLLLAGDSAAALALFTGDWPGYHPRPFHPAFAVTLRDLSAPDLPAPDGPGGAPGGYRRSLNFRTGVAVTSWPGRRHTCFVSRARDLVVQHVTSTAPVDLVAGVTADLPGAPPGLRVSTQVREHGASEAQIVTTVGYPDDPRHGYVGVTRVVAGAGGLVAAMPGGGVRVTGGPELTLLTRVAVTPECDSDEPGVPADPYRLLTEHARLHSAAYRDVRLDLGAPAADRELSVSELLDRQAAQPDRPLPALLEKLFDSGRYLLLSASGLLPSRLPGLWQGDWNAAWSGAITCNANLGVQLAGAVTADVPAAVEAVADLIRDRLPDWRLNARRLFGARGFVVPAHSDGRSGLCTHFEAGYPHQMWTAGADWLLAPLLDAVLAWGDTEFGRARVWPVVRELALFYEDFLTRLDSGGHAVFAPSYSPENQPRGWSAAAVNAVMDIAAARHTLTAAAEIAEIAGDGWADGAGGAGGAGERDACRWRELAARLPPYRTDADGALAEWAWPPAGSGLPPLPGSNEHRHVSHLYPVWPLHEITVAGAPELAEAALRALRMRGAQDESAHGYLHRALAAARLRDPRLAGSLLAALIGQGFFFRSLMSSHYPKRSVYNADAACALPGVLIEMLVDSWPPDRIELLPAVPDFLPAGRVRGVRTLTGVLVADLRWDIPAGYVEAVLISRPAQAARSAQAARPAQAGRAVCVKAGRSPWRQVVLPPARPVRITVGPVD
jgi:alpha-L-fucosidase 2